MSLFSTPAKTLYYFSLVLLDAVKFPLKWTINPNNRAIVIICILILMSILGLRTVEGAHTPLFKVSEHYFWYFLWWFGLGVASSIGCIQIFSSILSTKVFLSFTFHRSRDWGSHWNALYVPAHLCCCPHCRTTQSIRLRPHVRQLYEIVPYSTVHRLAVEIPCLCTVGTKLSLATGPKVSLRHTKAPRCGQSQIRYVALARPAPRRSLPLSRRQAQQRWERGSHFLGLLR